MIHISQKGDFKKTEKLLLSIQNPDFNKVLSKYGSKGVEALSQATPVRTGKTASSWYYTIEPTNGGVSIVWSNSNVNRGCNIAVLLQYGHGTRNGGYVAGRDYINPAIRPLFDEIANEAWKEVTK